MAEVHTAADVSYRRAFYGRRHAETTHSASTVLGVVREIVPDVTSAVDLGCGVGTWLSVLREQGVDDVLGIDGPWVDVTQLAIPADRFLEHDLGAPLDLPRRYDLGISLEVAEHLPAERADVFVDSLTGLSDVLLFSAAVPGQGGVNHLNEQWPDYWIRRFEARGYVALDVIRPRIWNDESIRFWYRQNAMLIARSERLDMLRLPTNLEALVPRAIVHPVMLEKVAREAATGPVRRFVDRAIGKAARTLRRSS